MAEKKQRSIIRPQTARAPVREEPRRDGGIPTIRPTRIEHLWPYQMPDEAIQSMREAAEANRGKPTTIRRTKLG
jgi:hypothetical protein